MKTIRCFSAFVVFCLLAQLVAGANVMKIKNATAQAGEVITVEVEITNDDPFAAFNCDIPLPAGFTYVPGTATLYRASGHSLAFDIVSGNTARAISFAIPSTNFLGNSGVVLSFDVSTPSAAGTHTLNLVSAVISDMGGNDILTSTQSGTIVLEEEASENIMKIKNATAQAGDVVTIEVEITNDDPFAAFNCDIPLPAGFTYVPGTATIYRSSGHSLSFDIVSGNTARAISFAIPSTNFLGNTGVVLSFDVSTPSAAGTHTLNLVSAVISDLGGNDILTSTQSGTIVLEDIPSGNVMMIRDINAEAGSTINVELEIFNTDPFAAFNLDIPLPAGFTYVPNSATLYRANGHTLSLNIISGNVARAISFAIPTNTFTGNSGVIMSFQLYTPATPGTYMLHIENAVISDVDGNNIITGTQPGTVLLGEPPTGFTLEVQVILEGAYTSGGPDAMHTILRDNLLVPLAQPFNPSLPYFGNNNPLWLYNGSESVSSVPSTVVDWVLVELRDAPSPAQATPATVIAQKAAFLHNDGFIRDVSGGNLSFNLSISNSLYVVVYHRNHLAVMSAGALPFWEGVYSWNFTQDLDKAFTHVVARSGYLQGHKDLGGGVFGMYGGDGDGNGQIQTQDKNNVWNTESGLSGYRAGDFDMNSQVQTQDKNNIWNANSGVASQVP
ncbi:MAG: hypothetical protein ACOC12_08575 [Bacteroidota bacterium]